MVCGAKRSQQGGEELPSILGSESQILHEFDRAETCGNCMWHSHGCHTVLLSQLKVSVGNQMEIRWKSDQAVADSLDVVFLRMVASL